MPAAQDYKNRLHSVLVFYDQAGVLYRVTMVTLTEDGAISGTTENDIKGLTKRGHRVEVRYPALPRAEALLRRTQVAEENALRTDAVRARRQAEKKAHTPRVLNPDRPRVIRPPKVRTFVSGDVTTHRVACTFLEGV